MHNVVFNQSARVCLVAAIGNVSVNTVPGVVVTVVTSDDKRVAPVDVDAVLTRSVVTSIVDDLYKVGSVCKNICIFGVVRIAVANNVMATQRKSNSSS